MRRLCVGKPTEWWTPDDDGARLGLMLCNACPFQSRCGDGDPHPHGVIRAGVAWSDYGVKLAICPCGYPETRYEDGRVGAGCRNCAVPSLDVMRVFVQHHAAAGESSPDLGRRFGCTPKTIRDALKRWALAPSTTPERNAA